MPGSRVCDDDVGVRVMTWVAAAGSLAGVAWAAWHDAALLAACFGFMGGMALVEALR